MFVKNMISNFTLNNGEFTHLIYIGRGIEFGQNNITKPIVHSLILKIKVNII